MATQKQQETELIAIYRLEFYKKQKKWKLSNDARKEKELQNSYPKNPVKNRKILNETYSVDTRDDNASVFDNAFLKDVSDKDAPVSPTAHTSLCTQWLEPINICQQCQHTDIKPQNPWADYVNDGWNGGLDVDRCSGDGNDCDGFDGWVEGMIWTNSGIPQPVWTGDVAAPMNIQGVECPQPAWPADTVLLPLLDRPHQLTPWPDDQMWAADVWAEDDLLLESLESVDEFMIGAHSAPHSSEVELCAPAEGDGGELSQGSLSGMSGAALSAAVRRHTGSLRRLLREAGQRRKYKSTLSLDVCAPDNFGLASRDFFSTDYSYEAFPTRDIPTTCLSPVYLYKDGFPPLLPANQFVNGLTSLPTNLCEDGFIPLTPTNQFQDGFTPPPPANRCKEGFTSLPCTYECKDGFNPLPPINQYQDGFTPLPPKNHREDGFNPLQPANQYKDSFIPRSLANLYRDGFLAGSYRNKMSSGFVGRGRGRLQEDRVEA